MTRYVRLVEYITHWFHHGAKVLSVIGIPAGIHTVMSKLSVDEDLKPNEVFVEDAEAQSRDLGTYSHNINAK